MDTINIQEPVNPADEIWAILRETDRQINNLALKGEVCCSPEVLHSGFNTFLTALKGGVLNPSARMKKTDRKIGELSNRFGELAEHLVAPGIARRFNARGLHAPGTLNCQQLLDKALNRM
jgi:hypothetical protein